MRVLVSVHTEADLGSWLDGWQNDATAVATGLDPRAIRAESARKIGAWNDVGRGISERFLAAAAEAVDQSCGVR